ncbi:MAG TPA: FAD-dependent oxidoreductase [Acidobacteriota bacterium]|nr:FAD-dependent oxidoreductase [Acidobacteriota bacterium]
MSDKMKKAITRRTFMKGTAAGAIVGTTGGWTAEGADAAPAAPSKTYSFEIPPPAIPVDQIKETITAEVVIIGAGTSGLVCANAAVENGATVVVIASSSTPVGRGGSNHAFNSKLMRRLGLKSDVAREFKDEMKCHSFRIDQDKWWLWAHKSGEAMDWLIDKMEAAGYQSVIELGNTDPDGIMTMYPGSHSWLGKNMEAAGRGQQLVVDTLAKTAKARGVRIDYNTTAVRLVREDNNAGRISAVIAKTPEGAYTRYAGTKAVVLATGDFKDEEMVEKYCPWVLPLVKAGGGVYSGDGHKIALWVGAAWQKTLPNAPMILGRVGPETQPYRAFTGLLVNKNAVRYGNEDRLVSFAGIAQMRQPDTTVFAIWDSTYAERAAPWTPAGSYYGGPPQIPVQTVVDEWEAYVKAGMMVKADTLEGLAERLGLPIAPLKATIERYNGFCKTGIDADYHKRTALLVSVETAPFYGAISRSPQLLCISGGLRTNIKMQVLDKNEQVIPGLYAVGTIVGDMYSNVYTFLEPGHNLGATCVTFGYLVGKEVAG